MQVCSVIPHVGKFKTKVVFGIMSLLLLLFVLPKITVARDYHIEVSNGEVYTITVGEEADVENFSIRRLDGQLVAGVTEDERDIITELYNASRILTFLRKHYSPERPSEDYAEWVRVIGDDAFDKLKLRQLATVVASNSLTIISALTTGVTAIELPAIVLGEINGAIADHLQRRLLLDAYFVALTFASKAVEHENKLRSSWLSYETRSIAIPITELNSVLHSIYSVGEYLILSNELVVTYLRVPGFKERMLDFFKSIIPGTFPIDTLTSIQYSDTHIQEVRNLYNNSEREISQDVYVQRVVFKNKSRTLLEEAGFFAPLVPPPSPEGVIPTLSLTLEGGSHPIDVAPYFSSVNILEYEAGSTPSGIVTGTISGSVITIIPESPGNTTIVVTARDTVTGLTAIQTIPVFVRQSQATITRPINTDPTWTPTTISNPRAEGLRERVSVIVDGLAPGNILNVREDAGTNYQDKGDVRNGDYGIITDGPRFSGGYTWWEIDWDTQRLDGWSAEVIGGVQLLFRRPPDLEIRKLDVSDSEVSPGERIELEIEIRNNGPGESAPTDVYIYYSENRHTDLEDLSEDSDLRGGWKLSVPSIRERRTETLTYRVDAPTELDSYYYGALLPSNVFPSDNTDHLDEDSYRNNLAREERVRVVGYPDYIVESISLNRNSTTFDPGDSFTLRATVRNIGTGEPRSSPTLDYYRSNDARISSSDGWVGDDSVAKLESNETTTRSISLTAPSEPGVYYYGACVSEVRNESDRSNNCSGAIAITVRYVPTPVEVTGSPDLVVTLTSNSNLVDPNEFINLTANIRNQGDADASNSTTVRYYLSTDATVSSDDQLIATDSVSILTEGGSDNEDHGVRAPILPGQYYYYVCVDSITGEEDTSNNCSNFIIINVRGSDLIVSSVSVDLLGQTGGINPNGEFILNATIRNQGEGSAAATTARIYISADQTLSTINDTEVQTISTNSISSGVSTTVQSSRIRSPYTSGVFYCFVCMDSLSNETDTSNNCSEPILISVNNVAPRARGSIPTQALKVGTIKSLGVSNYFTDANNDMLNYTANSSDDNIATATISGFQVTLTPKKAGSATITVTATDGSLSATQTFSVSVTFPNRAPTAVGTIAAQTLIIGEAAKVINVSANFSDPDNDTLRFTATSNKRHIATVSTSGSQITITPVSEGNATITVTASDDKLSATQTISISVEKANSSPIAVGTISARTLTVGDTAITIDVSSNFNDPDDDSLNYTASSNNNSVATVTVSGSIVSITPVAAGSATITVTASDGELTATQTIAVSVAPAPIPNRSPVAVGTISARTLTVGDAAITIDVSSNFNDPDDDNLTYTVSSNNTSVATVSVSGSVVTITPIAAGSATITITASDDELTATQTVSVTVTAAPIPNRAPITIGAISDQTLTVGDAAITIDISSNFNDPDDDNLTYTVSSNNTSVATVSVSGAIVTITPVAAGSATITITASDDELTATQTISVSVTAAPIPNRAPVAVGTISARTLTVGDAAIVINVLTNFSDPDNDNLVYTASSNNTSVATVSVSGAIVTITPVAAGSATITITASDDELTATLTMSITVTNVPLPNQPPVTVSTIPAQNLTTNDNAITLPLELYFDDPENDTLTYTATSDNATVSTASVAVNQLTITPVNAGSATITVRASDGEFTATQTISVTVAVHVTEAALMPDANLRSEIREQLRLQEGDTLTQELIARLTVLDADNNRLISDLTGLEHATNLKRLALWHNQINDITPLQNLTSLTNIDLRNNQITDISALQNLTNLTRLNLGHNGTITDISSLQNLTNLEHLSLSLLGFSDITPLQNLTELTSLNLQGNQISDISSLQNLTNLTILFLNGNQISDITPLQNLTNLTRLNLIYNQISDITPLQTLTKLTELQIRVNPITDSAAVQSIIDNNPDLSIDNNPPVAVGTIPDQTLTVGGTSIPVDVEPYFNEPDNTSLEYSVSSNNTSVATGAATNNRVTITPHTVGSATITVTASDGQLTISQTFSVSVISARPNNRAPVAIGTISAQSLTVGGASVQIDVSSNFNDPDNDTLTYTVSSSNESVATVSVSGSQVTITPVAAGSATITVTASDGELTAPQTISVTVNAAVAEETWMPDANLRERVRSTLGLQEGDILTQQAMTGLTTLGAQNEISDIRGLEYATNITVLHIGITNDISDITPLGNLTKLTNLVLSANNITDITPLQSLTALISLDLRENKISDITPLENLTNLVRLSLDENQISNITPLENLTNLTDLNLWNNQISDITSLEELTALTELELGINQISNLSALEDLTALTALSLQNNQISDLTPLEDLTALTWLSLTGNQISNLAPLDGLTSLGRLQLGSNQISDITPLQNLTDLAGSQYSPGLDLSFNQIINISPLQSLTNLKQLRLKSNNIANVSPLENLTALTDLFIAGNPILDYAPLRRHKLVNTDIRIDIDLTNNIPVFTEGASTTRSVAENTASGVNIGTAVSATDVDTDDTLTYSLSGTDAESFSIVSSSGQLQTSAALDYETKTSYSVTIRAYDGNSAADFIDVTINVTDDPNAAPSAQPTPSQTSLLPNYPNPFNPETWIPYQLSKPTDVALTIYNVHGAVVRQLAFGHRAAGVYYSRNRAAHWDGKNNLGEEVSAGVYFVKFKAGDYTKIRKMLIRK